MRRYRALFDRIVSFESLLRAYRLARRAGRVRPQTTSFDYDLEPNLLDLQCNLLAGTYAPGPYRSFLVAEPKERLVSAAPFRDRVVHHAVVGVLEPPFERRFVHDSYACRKGKGTGQRCPTGHIFYNDAWRYCPYCGDRLTPIEPEASEKPEKPEK